MKYAIICPEKDPAAIGVHKALTEEFNFKKTITNYEGGAVYGNGGAKLYTTGKDSIACDNIDGEIDADIFIFATRHQGAAGVPLFSTHSQGNWGKADFGGKPRELGTAPAAHLKHALRKLEEFNTIGFDVVQEATHHGPSISKPCMFIEVGSTGKEWVRHDAAKIVARAIASLVSDEVENVQSAIGIGGPHHCPNFRKIMLGENISVAHVCAKYALENLDEEMLKQAIERTMPRAGMIILDWKGLGDAKQRIKALAEQSGLEVRRTSEF